MTKLALLGLSYPVLVHVAVATQSAPLMLGAVLLLVLLALAPGLARGSGVAWAAVLPCLAGVLILHRAHAIVLLLYVPPVAINVALAWSFAHTLVAGRVPLIERLVRLLHAPGETLDPAIPPYARRLTGAWALLFVAMAATNLALAAVAVPGGLLLRAGIQPPIAVPGIVWSAFSNFFNYLIVVAFFVAEYAYRQRRFPQQPYDGFVDFCARAAAVLPRLLVRDGVRHPAPHG